MAQIAERAIMEFSATPMKAREKLVALEDLPRWRERVRLDGKRLVVTNGCFDLLHAGHVTYLESARDEGDLLLVGLNGDESVRALKGDGRPINSEQDRAIVLAALEAISAVCIFPEVRAASFLSVAKPDIYVKGGDYTLESLDREERSIVERAGGKIVLIPFLPGRSTTRVVEKLSGKN